MSNPYWKNICSLAEKQRSKGIATYGQGLEANPADVVARINHLQEELIDALMYCEWIKDTIVPCQGCKWIPVTERLPERGQEVIVFSGGYLKPNVFAYHFWSSEFNSWQGITHWMPMPEMPKE